MLVTSRIQDRLAEFLKDHGNGLKTLRVPRWGRRNGTPARWKITS
jgi:hypothetical protein